MDTMVVDMVVECKELEEDEEEELDVDEEVVVEVDSDEEEEVEVLEVVVDILVVDQTIQNTKQSW
jgi:hypothetical protein